MCSFVKSPEAKLCKKQNIVAPKSLSTNLFAHENKAALPNPEA